MKGDDVVQENSFVRLPDRVQAAAFRILVSIKDKAGSPLAVKFN